MKNNHIHLRAKQYKPVTNNYVKNLFYWMIIFCPVIRFIIYQFKQIT